MTLGIPLPQRTETCYDLGGFLSNYNITESNNFVLCTVYQLFMFTYSPLVDAFWDSKIWFKLSDEKSLQSTTKII